MSSSETSTENLSWIKVRKASCRSTNRFLDNLGITVLLIPAVVQLSARTRQQGVAA